MGSDLLGALECLVDAHTHLPVEPIMEPGELVSRLRRQGPRAAVILGIPPARDVVSLLDLDAVRREHARVEGLIRRYAAEAAERLRPENLYYSVIDLLRRYGELCSLEPRGRGYVILAAADLSLPPDVLASRLERLASRGFAGFKVISTLHFRFLDDPAVEAVFEVASSRGLPVVVHSGCDPGIWELPRYCRYGDPSRLEGVLRRYRDVPVVIAHMGGYSAIAPGVFTREAVELARRYENVYLDTSALPVLLVKIAARSLPRGRILFGTDYPVIDVEDTQALAEATARALAAVGYSRSELEGVFHGNAEELFGVGCVDGGL